MQKGNHTYQLIVDFSQSPRSASNETWKFMFVRAVKEKFVSSRCHHVLSEEEGLLKPNQTESQETSSRLPTSTAIIIIA